jgi:hypothetical protein
MGSSCLPAVGHFPGSQLTVKVSIRMVSVLPTKSPEPSDAVSAHVPSYDAVDLQRISFVTYSGLV